MSEQGTVRVPGLALPLNGPASSTTRRAATAATGSLSIFLANCAVWGGLAGSPDNFVVRVAERQEVRHDLDESIRLGRTSRGCATRVRRARAKRGMNSVSP